MPASQLWGFRVVELGSGEGRRFQLVADPMDSLSWLYGNKNTTAKKTTSKKALKPMRRKATELTNETNYYGGP